MTVGLRLSTVLQLLVGEVELRGQHLMFCQPAGLQRFRMLITPFPGGAELIAQHLGYGGSSGFLFSDKNAIGGKGADSEFGVGGVAVGISSESMHRREKMPQVMALAEAARSLFMDQGLPGCLCRVEQGLTVWRFCGYTANEQIRIN